MSHLELYERLGFDNNEVTLKEIKRRYRKLVQECHPDKFPGDEDKEHQFKMIVEAYEILSDEAKRKAYDSEGTMDSGSEEDRVNDSAINILTKLLSNTLDTIPEHLMDTVDIREPIFENIQENLNKKNEAIEQVESIIRKNKKAMKKLTRKSDESNIFKKALTDRIALLSSHLKMLKFIVRVCNRMKEIVEDYDYDFTEMQAPSFFTDGPIQITFRGRPNSASTSFTRRR